MGSRTFDGVRFAAWSDDHDPPHVHGYYAGITVVIDLLIAERAVRVARRKSSVRPANAKKSDINYVRRAAVKHFDDLVLLWEKAL